MKKISFVTLLLLAGIAWSFQVSSGSHLQQVKQGATDGEKSRQVVASASGVMESGRTDEFRNRLPGNSTLLYIVPHGERVHKGDLLFELDDSDLREKFQILEIELQSANGAVRQAEAQFRLIEAKQQTAIDSAEDNLKIALMKQQSVIEENGQLAVQSRVLERELETLTTKAGYLVELKKQAHPKFDLQSRFLLHDIETQIENTRDKLKQHKEQTVPLETAIAERDVRLAERELSLREIELRSAMTAADSHLDSKRAALDLAKTELDLIHKMREQCKVVATRDGIALHPQPPGRRVAATPLEEGSTVREMQTIVTMPDLEVLLVRARLHESQTKYFEDGDRVTIRVDALPDENYTGVIREIKPLPAARNNQARQFELVALVGNPDERLRPGMTCRVTLDKKE